MEFIGCSVLLPSSSEGDGGDAAPSLDQEWITSDMQSLCFAYGPPVCHEATIPDELFMPASVCSSKSTADCRILPNGPGKDTDFVIFLTNSETAACATPKRELVADELAPRRLAQSGGVLDACRRRLQEAPWNRSLG